MKRLSGITMGLLVVAVAMSGGAQMSSLTDAGWVMLIDGEKGLENFNRVGGANWRAEDGAIQAEKSTTKGSSVSVSKRSFKDFELYAEFRADHDTNSGLCVSCTGLGKVSSASACEAQIRDQNPDPSLSAGALLAAAEVTPMYKAGGR